MSRAIGRCLWLAATAFGLAAATPASAEIYKCVGPDGKTLFTSDASQCPGAERHQPSGRLERVPAPAPSSVRRPPASFRSPGNPAHQEAAWRGKKLRAEAELRDLEGRLEHVREAVGWCNRGHSLYVEDETGIRRGYDCSKVRNEHEEIQARMAGLRLYLDEGLEEECRRAGCLPGWIR